MSRVRVLLAVVMTAACAASVVAAMAAHRQADRARQAQARAAAWRTDLDREQLAAALAEAQVGELEARYAALDGAADAAVARIRLAIRSAAAAEDGP